MRPYWAILFVFTLILFQNGCSQNPSEAREDTEQLSQAITRSFDIQVATIGILDAARSHMLSSEIRGDDGKIIFIVADGMHVKKGELLIKIDQTPFEEKVLKLTAEVSALKSGIKAKEQIFEWEKNQVEKNSTTAEFNLTVAKLEYKKLTEGDGPLQISQFTADVAKNKQDYDKYLAYREDLEILEQNGFSNPSEISQAKKKIEEYQEKYESALNTLSSYRDHVYPSLERTAHAKVEKAEMDILQTKNAGVIQITKAIAELEEVKGALISKEAELNQALGELSKSELHAPFDGIAILYETYRDGEKRKPRVGDRIIRNQPILYLPDITSMVVKTNIREVDLHKISLDQKVKIQVDAYPNLTLKGRVTFIGALASEVHNSGMGGKYFKVTIAIDTKELRLRPGMTARITILADQIKDALSVPVNAVFLDGEKAVCYRHSDTGYKRVEVTAGRQNLDYIEILSGLAIGDRISLIKPDTVSKTNHREKGVR